MTFRDLLLILRSASYSERDKGFRFEILIKRWLLADPLYAALFDKTWLWSEFTKEVGLPQKDLGIDVVARYRDGSGYAAVQCKFYDNGTTINKSMVDSFISASAQVYKPKNHDIQSFKFVGRIWVSTACHFGVNAYEAIQNQDPPVSEVTLNVLEASPVDWDAIFHGNEQQARKPAKPRDYQAEIVKQAVKHYETHDRGTLVMACGTGKTLTSLFIAQELCKGQGQTVLFLAPSIALVAQTMRSWYACAELPIQSSCVCSDPTASNPYTKNEDGDEQRESLINLPPGASTNPNQAAKLLLRAEGNNGLTVIFSTYQSIDVVHQAQQMANVSFDLVICDEAHRTASVYHKKQKDSGIDMTAFVRVHDGDYIKAKRRLYMTATPKVYALKEKDYANNADDLLFSMDDEKTFGPHFYELKFSEAVQMGILTDYKVIVLTMGAGQTPNRLLESMRDASIEWDLERQLEKTFDELDKALNPTSDEEKDTDTQPVYKWSIIPDMTTRILGSVAAMSKRVMNNTPQELDPFKDDDKPNIPLHSAIAFCDNVHRTAKTRTGKFVNDETAWALDAIVKQCSEALLEDSHKKGGDRETEKYVRNLAKVVSSHVSGDMATSEREEALEILRNPVDGESHIVCNVSCLSEGIDVPALDAIIFLSPRKSPITLIQSVGRVMRKYEGKKYGYVIIPVIVNYPDDPEEIVRSSEFRIVWDVLAALKSHDDSLASELSNHTYNHVIMASLQTGSGSNSGSGSGSTGRGKSGTGNVTADAVLPFLPVETTSLLYARLSDILGDRFFWPRWSKKAGEIAKRFIDRITNLIEEGRYVDEMNNFVEQLHESVNNSLTQADAITFLAQHMVTKPVFDALFPNYSFAENNNVSRAMEAMLAKLKDEAFADDQRLLDSFCKQVERLCQSLDTPQKRQNMIRTLYEQFFKAAFPKVTEQMGIVYTPVECVDFIVRSVDDILRRDFHKQSGIAETECLDPFAGTGTFTTCAINHLARKADVSNAALKHAYRDGLHCFEIVPLSYYVADVNIETTFNDLDRIKLSGAPYECYDGITLTDTFQLMEERGILAFDGDLGKNARAAQQVIRGGVQVIWGNPPYSVGQKSANDNAQNIHYKAVEDRIAFTYASGSTANSVKSLYDSYIKAFRWASDLVAEHGEKGGIVAFISNAGWIEGNGQDGMRRCLVQEWDDIYIFHLRGNCRTSGVTRKSEGENVFGQSSRTPVAITILVRRPGKRAEEARARILLADVGDYLTREDKLARLTEVGSVLSPAFAEMAQEIHPNDKADWINQRDGSFDALTPISPEKKFDPASKSFFIMNSLGQATAKDPFLYNFSKDQLRDRAKSLIDFYNENRIRFHRQKENLDPKNFVEYNSQKISWNRSLLNELKRGDEITFSEANLGKALYRPFMVQNVYYERKLVEMIYQVNALFPTPRHRNLAICVSGVGVTKDFSCIITDCIPDLELSGKSQCYPLWRYESRDEARAQRSDGGLFADDPTAGESAEGWAAAGFDDDGYLRQSAITDYILKEVCRAASVSAKNLAEWRLALGGTLGMLGDPGVNPKRLLLGKTPSAQMVEELAKEAIFFITYAQLHSPTWRDSFAPDLKKSLPRLPLPESADQARHLLSIGHRLALLHLYAADGLWRGTAGGYAIPAAPAEMKLVVDHKVVEPPFKGVKATVDKMKWADKYSRDKLIIAGNIGLQGIPEAAQRYVVNGKSALEWLVDRIVKKQDQASGIVNDPNEWAREQGDPAFVVKLVWRTAVVACESTKLIDEIDPPQLSLPGAVE